MGIAVAVIVVLVVVVVAFVMMSKSPAKPELPEGDEQAKPLPPASTKPNELRNKLEGRREEMKSQPKKADPEPDQPPATAPTEAIKEAKKPDVEAPPKAQPAKVESAVTPAVDQAAQPAATESAPQAAPVAAQVATPAPAPAPPKAPPPPKKQRVPDVAGMRQGLAKSRASEGFFGRLSALVTGRKEIAPEIVAEIEEVLLTSDVGAKTTEKLLGLLRDGLQRHEMNDTAAVWAALRGEMKRVLDIGPPGVPLNTSPTVVMMVGVNGAGKTTTIGKLASKFKAEGRKVVLAAGDTFRAAAVQQLQLWGKKAECEVVTGKEGADPASVAFDAVQKAREIGADVVLVDTAGRLQTKTPLMDELRKVAKTVGKAMDGAPHETLLVLDATTGQNAVQQAKLFQETLPLTGIVLTKLDGTAKGGVIMGIADELAVPVRYVGLGERAADLHEFVAEEFVEALFGDA